MTKSANEAELRKTFSDILLGRAITDKKMIEKFSIKPLTHQQSVTKLLALFAQERTKLLEEVLGVLPERIGAGGDYYHNGYDAAVGQIEGRINQLIKEQG